MLGLQYGGGLIKRKENRKMNKERAEEITKIAWELDAIQTKAYPLNCRSIWADNKNRLYRVSHLEK